MRCFWFRWPLLPFSPLWPTAFSLAQRPVLARLPRRPARPCAPRIWRVSVAVAPVPWAIFACPAERLVPSPSRGGSRVSRRDRSLGIRSGCRRHTTNIHRLQKSERPNVLGMWTATGVCCNVSRTMLIRVVEFLGFDVVHGLGPNVKATFLQRIGQPLAFHRQPNQCFRFVVLECFQWLVTLAIGNLSTNSAHTSVESGS